MPRLIGIKLTDADAERFDLAAQERGETIATWMRTTCREKLDRGAAQTAQPPPQLFQARSIPPVESLDHPD